MSFIFSRLTFIIFLTIFFHLLGASNEKLYDGITSPETFEGDHEVHFKTFSQQIVSAHVYTFRVKLIAPSIEQQTGDGNFITKEMESDESIIKCYSKPSKPSGTIFIFIFIFIFGIWYNMNHPIF